MVHILGQHAPKHDGTVGFISPQDIDSGRYSEDPEYSDEFEPIYWLLMEYHDIRMDPTLSMDKQMEGAEIGLLTVDFAPWSATINWSTTWQEGLPPHNYRVKYRGEAVAVMSPYLLVRTCPFCRLGDPRVNGLWDPAGLFLHTYCPRHPITGQETRKDFPAVAPAHACRGPAYQGKLLGTCRQFDWFGTGILLGSGEMSPREVLQRDAAEALAVRTNKDKFAQDFAQPYNYDALKQVSDIDSRKMEVAS